MVGSADKKHVLPESSSVTSALLEVTSWEMGHLHQSPLEKPNLNLPKSTVI